MDKNYPSCDTLHLQLYFLTMPITRTFHILYRGSGWLRHGTVQGSDRETG